MGYCNRIALLFLLLLPFIATAHAQKVGQDFGLLTYVVPDGEDAPVSASTLLYHPKNGIERLPARLIETNLSVSAKRYSVATTFRLEKPFVPFYYSIFLRAADGSITSTKVRLFKESELDSYQISETALRTDLVKLEREFHDVDDGNSLLKESRALLREEISSLAQVDTIIAETTELSLGRRALKEKDELAAHLKTLSRSARKVDAPANIDSIRKTLSIHLRDAAQVTSAANRLNRRRNEAAEARFRQKLKLVKNSKEEDAGKLAKEVLKLRRQRQVLEDKLVPRRE